MTDTPPASLDVLRTFADQLNQVTDEAGEAVRSVEDFLGKCSITSDEFVEVGKDPSNDKYKLWLEYRKVAQKHRIVVVWTEPPNAADSAVKPWSDCARPIKLATVAKLPDLLAKIVASVQKQKALADCAAGAITRVSEMLATIKEGA